MTDNRQNSSKIFRSEVKFIAGAAKISQLPKIFLPQVAFVGKSNVGKSSLINKVCNRKSLARISNTPGRTRQINFFNLANKLILTDLPGYGFAKVSAKEQQEWEKLIIYYLQNSHSLELVNILIDARRGIKENDLTIINMLSEFNKKIQIVFTKSDKIKINEKFLEENKKSLATLGYSCNVIITSSKSGLGAKELQISMAKSIGKK